MDATRNERPQPAATGDVTEGEIIIITTETRQSVVSRSVGTPPNKRRFG